MEFKDFENNYDELVGKTVLYEIGQTYSDKRNWLLLRIDKVTKAGFKLFSMPNALFSFRDGSQKGLTARAHMSTISQCRLVTEEEADELRRQWAQNKRERELREKMQEKLKTMTYEQLQKMDLL